MDPTLWKLAKFFRAAESFRIDGGIYNFTPHDRCNTGVWISEEDQEEIIELRRKMAEKYQHYRCITDFGSAAERTRAEVLRDYLEL